MSFILLREIEKNNNNVQNERILTKFIFIKTTNSKHNIHIMKFINNNNNNNNYYYYY